jgi:hypothetical protein
MRAVRGGAAQPLAALPVWVLGHFLLKDHALEASLMRGLGAAMLRRSWN